MLFADDTITISPEDAVKETSLNKTSPLCSKPALYNSIIIIIIMCDYLNILMRIGAYYHSNYKLTVFNLKWQEKEKKNINFAIYNSSEEEYD